MTRAKLGTINFFGVATVTVTVPKNVYPMRHLTMFRDRPGNQTPKPFTSNINKFRIMGLLSSFVQLFPSQALAALCTSIAKVRSFDFYRVSAIAETMPESPTAWASRDIANEQSAKPLTRKIDKVSSHAGNLLSRYGVCAGLTHGDRPERLGYGGSRKPQPSTLQYSTGMQMRAA
jgi:hypothetical protein